MNDITASVGTSVDANPSRYPFSRGLDYLDANSTAQTRMSELLARSWDTALSGQSRPFRICDYGTGTGELAARTVTSLSSRTRSRIADGVLVDRDRRSAVRAATRVRKRTGTRTVALDPDEFRHTGGRFEVILLSHVLYYVSDRMGLLTSLLDRLDRGGVMSIVLRSVDCDTFKVRSALRAASPGPAADQTNPRPRITSSMVIRHLEDHGMNVRTTDVRSHLSVDADRTKLSELGSPRHTTPETEFIRLLGHVPADPARRRETLATLREELDRRTVDRKIDFCLSETLITAVHE